MTHARTTQLYSILIGFVLSLVVFYLLGTAYRIGRHAIKQTDQVAVLGQSRTVNWKIVDALQSGRGLVVSTPLVSSSVVTVGEPSENAHLSVMHASEDTLHFASLKSNETTPIQAELASRSIVNRFGTEIYSWQCSVIGAMNPENNSDYFLLVTATGGGDVGATVNFDIKHQRDSEFVLTVTERLWSSTTRQCTLRFGIDEQGEIFSTE